MINILLFWFALTSSVFICYSKPQTNSACDLKETNSSVIFSNTDCLCPIGKQCLRKCCFSNHIKRNGICGASDDDIKLTDRPFLGNMSNFVNEINASDHVHIIHGHPCKMSYNLNPNEEFVTLMKNGTLQTNFGDDTLFCLEYVEEEKQVLPFVCLFQDESELNPLNDEIQILDFTTVTYYVSMGGYLLSIIFLALTVIVYFILPLLHSSLNGKNMMCYAFASFIGYTFIFIIKGSETDLFNLKQPFCSVAALVVQYSFLSSFFWLNVMCFDLWWTFSGFRSFSGSVIGREGKKFFFYCLYAWGCPTLIVSVTVIVEYVPEIHQFITKPDFGKRTCWFDTTLAMFQYFYSFISIIVILNICMFISTALTLNKHRKETKVLQRSGSRRHIGSVNKEDKQRFNLYLKLFAIMGVNWILDLMSFYLPDYNSVWQVTDIINSVQGVLVFLIIVCKRRTLKLLNEKMCPCFKIFVRQSNSTFSTSFTNASQKSLPKKKSSKEFPLHGMGQENKGFNADVILDKF